MRVTWGYVWGIWWWRMTGQSMDPNRLRTNLVTIVSSIKSAEDLRTPVFQKLRDNGLKSGIPQGVPVDIVVAGRRIHVHNKCFVVHQWNGFVPIQSICATNDNYVASPEFCLLQTACIIKRVVTTRLCPWQYTVILAELVCELCGTYSKQNTTRGFKQRKNTLTNTALLTTFCGRIAHEPGASALRKALSWAVDGLNSPMETTLYLLLCLPKRYGGMELPRPLANPPIDVPEELWNKTRLRCIIPDLLWPETNLIVEYNGQEFHDERAVQDQERQELAQDMGYVVVTFRKDDLYDRRRFMAKAQSVAKHLHLKLPPSTTKFEQLQKLLHDMLLRHERWV